MQWGEFWIWTRNVFKKIKSKELQFDRLFWIGVQWSHLTSWIHPKEESLVLPSTDTGHPTHIMVQHPKRISQNCAHWNQRIPASDEWLTGCIPWGRNAVKRNFIANTLADNYENYPLSKREIHWYLVKPKMEIPTDRVVQPLKISCMCVQGDIYTVDYFQHFS